MPDSPTPEFEPTRLDAYLRDAIPGLEGRMQLDRISGGQSNPTFFVTYANRALVMRKQPPGALLPSAHAIDREYRVIRALAATPVPVPPAVHYAQDRSVIGTPFYIMERVSGRVFHDCTLPGVAPAERRAMYRTLAQTLARFHDVAPAAVGLADFGKPGNYFARQIARWARQWELSRTREDNQIDALVAWLQAHVPADDRTTLIHGDYRIGNAMFASEGGEMAALLDWELSTLGHPAADLAHCAISWLTGPDEFGGMNGLDLAARGIPSLEEFVADYAAAARDPAELTPFHFAFALFRWAVIFEGIAARALAGNAADDQAADYGRLAAGFAARGAAFITG